jgi:hypothetical protein
LTFRDVREFHFMTDPRGGQISATQLFTVLGFGTVPLLAPVLAAALLKWDPPR